MQILTDYPERIGDLEQVYLGSGVDSNDVTPYTVQSTRFNKDTLLLKLKTIKNRNQADNLRQQYVLIDIEHAIPLEDGEYYLYQLIGLSVETDDGKPLGIIRDVLETGANDVYILDSPEYGELLVPVHEETLVSTDIDDGIVIVKLPDGLLPEMDN